MSPRDKRPAREAPKVPPKEKIDPLVDRRVARAPRAFGTKGFRSGKISCRAPACESGRRGCVLARRMPKGALVHQSGEIAPFFGVRTHPGVSPYRGEGESADGAGHLLNGNGSWPSGGGGGSGGGCGARPSLARRRAADFRVVAASAHRIGRPQRSHVSTVARNTCAKSHAHRFLRGGSGSSLSPKPASSS